MFILFLDYLKIGRLSPCLTHPPEPLELPVSEQQELGYMPYRDDFERVRLSIYGLFES